MPSNVTATNVSTGKPKVGGAIFNAPIGTTLPTDATTDLPDAFVCVGHISDDGVDNEQELTTNDIKAWGGTIVLNALTEFKDNFKFKMIESKNANALKAYYGDTNVTVAGSGAVTVNVGAFEMPERVWAIETALRSGVKRRLVIPNGQVTARDAISYKDEDPIAYGVTVTATADSTGSTHKEYSSPESGQSGTS